MTQSSRKGKHPRTAAIAVARTGSTRFRRKMLEPFGSEPLFMSALRRVTLCQSVDEVILATTTHVDDDLLAEAADSAGIRVVRGSVDDVVSRMMLALDELDQRPDYIVRTCCDNPLVMPSIVDRTVELAASSRADMVTPFEYATLPFGYSMAVLSIECLERIDQTATARPHREHVENFCLDNPDEFKIVYHKAPKNLHMPDLCLTVDWPCDLDRLKSCLKVLDGVDMENQPQMLVDWVHSCRSALVSDNPKPTDIIAILNRLGFPGPEIVPVGSLLPEDRDLVIYDHDPGPNIRPAGSRCDVCTVLTPSGPARLEQIMPDGKRDVILSETAIHNESTSEFLARVLPFVLVDLAAGHPRPATAREGLAPAAEKVVTTGRKGFRAIADSLFPPRVGIAPGEVIRLTPDVLTPELSHASSTIIMAGDSSLDDLAASLTAAGLTVIRETPSPDPFATLVLDSSGNYSPYQSPGRFPDSSLKEAWQCARIRRSRVDLLNADLLDSGEAQS